MDRKMAAMIGSFFVPVTARTSAGVEAIPMAAIHAADLDDAMRLAVA
jgi:hypothetical protein